jgi:hypothetical protein
MSSIPDVLESARYVLTHADFVRVNEAAAQCWAGAQDPTQFRAPSMPPEFQFTGDPGACANFCLLRNCLNFCFWSERPWSVEFRGQTWTRTYAMFAAVLRAIEQDRTWLTARRWAEADNAAVAEMFAGQGEIPLPAERRAVLNETGRCLNEQFGGQCLHAVEQAGRHARTFANLLAERFPSFRDLAAYKGRDIALLKRAQICATDLHCLWRQRDDPGLIGMDELTVFADYRLPQYLRHVGIVELQPELAARIDRKQELAAGAPEEIELRAATIAASDLICRAFGGAVPPWKLDFFLWQRSHDPEVLVEHHRVRTLFY